MTVRRPQPALLARLVSAADKTEDVVERIVSTAVGQISDFGVRRFTIDELARRVGLSRVTIYRHFASKDEVLDAVVLFELRRFMQDVEHAVAPYDALDQKAVEGFVFALSALRGHTVLQRLLRTEPELILPLLTTSGAPIIDTAREFISSFPRRDSERGAVSIEGPQLTAFSEMLARLIISLVLTPHSALPLETEAEMRAFAEQYIGTVVRAFSAVPAG